MKMTGISLSILEILPIKIVGLLRQTLSNYNSITILTIQLNSGEQLNRFIPLTKASRILNNNGNQIQIQELAGFVNEYFINVGKINCLVNQTGDPSTNPPSDIQDCPSCPIRLITDIEGDKHFFEEDDGDIVNSKSDLSLEETLIRRIEIDTVIRLVREIIFQNPLV